MLKYGYQPYQIDAAINSLYAPHEIKHVIHFSPTALIAVISVVVGLLIIGIVGYNVLKPKTPAQLLDVKATILKEALKAGEKLEFNVELTSMGSTARYDVNLRYVVNDNKNKVITSKDETVGLETRTSAKAEINIPSNIKPGKYTLKVIAQYNNKVATATDSFRIYEETAEESCFDNIKNQDEENIDCGGVCEPCVAESCDDGIKNQGETGIDCGGPCKDCELTPAETCDDGIKNQGESGIDCGGPCPACAITPPPDTGQTVWEQLEAIKELAKANPQEATKECQKISAQTYKDQCFANIAEAIKDEALCDEIADSRTKDNCYSKAAELIKDSSLCEKIEKESRKDSCYMNFVMKEDYSVCDKIINQYLRQSCERLKEMKEIGS